MTNITVYDDTYKVLEDLSERFDVSIAEIIDSLLDFKDELY